MKPQVIIKRAIDLVITAFLLLLMAYHITGEAAHERIGAGMILLFIAHTCSTGAGVTPCSKGITPRTVFCLPR